MWVATSDGVYRKNGSGDWGIGGLAGEPLYSLAADTRGNLLAGGENGLWRLSSSAWSPVPSLAGLAVYDIEVTTDYIDGRSEEVIAVATERGLWATRQLVAVDAETAPSEAPSQLTLSAFPNPASGAVRITAVSPEAGPVRVRVFDVLGREVADLGSHASGATVTWSGAAPAGIYLVRAETATSTATTRITRLR